MTKVYLFRHHFDQHVVDCDRETALAVSDDARGLPITGRYKRAEFDILPYLSVHSDRMNQEGYVRTAWVLYQAEKEIIRLRELLGEYL